MGNSLLSRYIALAANITLALLSTAVVLVVAEIAFRLIAQSQEHHNPLRARPRMLYLPEKYNYEFHDRRYLKKRSENSFRIAVVGDSFTKGGKVAFDDSFAKRLERSLNRNDSQPLVEVLKFGVSGNGTAMEANVVKGAINHYKPDLILLQITLNDAEFGPHETSRILNLNRRTAMLQSGLYQNWKLYAFVQDRLYRHKLKGDLINYYKFLYNDQAHWKTFKRALISIKSTSESNKTPVVFFLFPIFDYPLDDRYPLTAEHQKIARFIAALNIPYLDLLPFYQGIEHHRLQAIPGEDSHPNEVAHRIAANTLLRWLTELELVPNEVVAKNSTVGPGALSVY